MSRSLLLLFSIATIVVGLDQWTKHWASRTLAYQPPVPVIGEFLQFTYTRNSGVAFGLGAGTGFPHYLFSIAAALVIVFMFLRGQVHGLPRQLALSLVLGGAVGNLIDRLRTGEVVDFIQILWGRFPVFNVADTAVSIGVALFAWSWTRREETPAAAPAGGHDASVQPLGAYGEPGREARPLSGDGTDGPLA